MTAPTIEKMDVEEFINHLESKCVVLSDEPFSPIPTGEKPKYYVFLVSEAEEMLEQFLDAKSPNALPLDEIPEGWFLRHIKFNPLIKTQPKWECLLFHATDGERSAVANGTTMAEALRAAIAKVVEK